MAYVNIHSIPGVTVTATYWDNLTSVPAPSNPLGFAAGVYSLTGTPDWDRVAFEVTSFGTGVLPVTGRISVVDAYVGGPYDGLVAIASGTTYGSTIAQTTISPDANRTVNCSAAMSLTNKYFLFGHNASGAGDIQNLAALTLELDGDFPAPVFWQDFNETTEDGTLTKNSGLVFVPTQSGNPARPETTYCLPEPIGPPICPGGTIHPVTGVCCPRGSTLVTASDGTVRCVGTPSGGGGGSDPPEGTRPPVDVLLCWPVPGGTCCRYPGIGVICVTF